MKTVFLYFLPFGALFIALWLFDVKENEPATDIEFFPQRAELSTAATGVVALSVANINQRIELSRQRLDLMEIQLDKMQGISKADTHTLKVPAIDVPVIPANDTTGIDRLVPYFSNNNNNPSVIFLGSPGLRVTALDSTIRIESVLRE